MKRFIVLFLCLILFTSASAQASSVLDAITMAISSLSFSELRMLDASIAEEMASRPEWKAVTVPPGAYTIGIDIPEGWWDISIIDKEYDYATVRYGKKLNKSGTDIEYSDEEAYSFLDDGKPTLSIYLAKTRVIVIDYNSVIFTPHVQPSLGF